MNNNTHVDNSQQNLLLFLGFTGLFSLVILVIMITKKSNCCNKYYVSKKDTEEYWASYVKGLTYEEV